MYKVDLHTHSVSSPDGGLDMNDYRKMLETGGLDAIAITDHDSIDFAIEAHNKLGSRIIIGQEISTLEGEIIGLFLKRSVPPAQSAEKTIHNIREQDGLVYIPHPFENIRKGLSNAVLDRIVKDVDIIEIYNGRAYLQNKSALAVSYVRRHKLAGAASSDAHGPIGWGRTYSIIKDQPSTINLATLLKERSYSLQKVGFKGIIYPKFNIMKKRIKHVA